MDAALVNISIWVVHEKVAQSLYSEFLLEKCSLDRSDSL
jgi:hypothetical protein